jgi:chemotaxis protein methyltransferase CheR
MSAADALSALTIPEPVPQLLRDLIHERMGIYFEPERFDALLDKLHARAVAQGCQSYLDYYYRLRYDSDNATEWRRVMDAFSVQETYFWREFDQIRVLVDVLVPGWFRTRLTPLRIWSAACATGEEPYSIAIALEEAGWGGHPIEVWGSDASEAALEKARTGVYRERSFRALPPELREKYFRPVPTGYELNRDIASRVRFRWANLVAESDIAELATSPVVFCRNVFIYFSPAAIARVAAALARHMPADGHLFLGASESLVRVTEEFELGEIGTAFVYRRRAAAA